MTSLQTQLVLIIASALLVALWSGVRTLRAKLRAEAELAHLGRRLLSAQESERARIACELHDGISQELAVVGLKLDNLECRLVGSAGQRADVALLGERVRAIATELQQVTRGLHPARLQHLGLVSSVRVVATELESDDLRIDVSESNWPEILPADVALSLYRVAQEALHNAAKYSRSNIISVRFRNDQDGLTLVVSDRGIGFAPDATGSSGGLGIASMRQRLRAVGGLLSITTDPGFGTDVCARIPPTRVAQSSSLATYAKMAFVGSVASSTGRNGSSPAVRSRPT